MERVVRRRFGRLAAGQLGVVMAVSLASVASFKAVFIDWDFMVPAAIGALGAASIVARSWWKKLLVGETLAVSAAALVLLGTVASSGVPTPQAFVTFAEGLVSGWAELLSLSPQFDDTPELRVLPFVLAWIATLLGGELLHRTAQPTLPAVGPLVGLTISALVTAENRTIATIQGIVIAVGALAVGRAEYLARRSSDETGPAAGAATPDSAGRDSSVAHEAPHGRRTSERRQWLGRLTRAAAVCLVVGVAAPFVGPRLPFADAYQRFDLRDRNVPPWDPVQVASPLVEVKATLKEDVRDDLMFTVASERAITRWNVAVLGDYDGTVWTVGSAEGQDAANEFRPVSSQLSERPDIVETDTESVAATITIDGLTGAFLPTAGWADTLQFTSAPELADPALGSDGAMVAQDRLRMNLVTGTVAVPTGVSEGLAYDLTVDLSPQLGDDDLDLLDAPLLDDVDQLDAVPPSVRNFTADIVEGLEPGWPRVAAIRDRFVNDGFYDVSELARPGHSYFRLAEFLAEPDRLVGFEEQYAAASATMVRVAELRSRVVVGYLIPEDRYVDGTAEVFGADLSAWIEVDFGLAGWVSVDVSPERSREPTSEATGVTVQDVAVPNPPPPPAIPPSPEVFADDEEADEVEEDDDEEEEEDVDDGNDERGTVWLAIVGLGAAGLLAIAATFALFIAGWKALRRRRRRRTHDTSASVAYAWQETVDRFVEAGTDVSGRATPREVSRAIETNPDHSVGALAAVVERAAFHEQPPAPDAAEAAWSGYDTVVDSIRRRHSHFARLRMATSLRTLRRIR